MQLQRIIENEGLEEDEDNMMRPSNGIDFIERRGDDEDGEEEEIIEDRAANNSNRARNHENNLLGSDAGEINAF